MLILIFRSAECFGENLELKGRLFDGIARFEEVEHLVLNEKEYFNI